MLRRVARALGLRVLRTALRKAARAVGLRLLRGADQRAVWTSWYGRYDGNPFGIDPSRNSKRRYLDLASDARNRISIEFLSEIEEAFGCLPDASFMDELALSTQVVIKESELNYMHGFLLYGALRKYLSEHPRLDSVFILETGTARGFSALCMAKALEDASRHGTIITIDILPSSRPIYWNSIHDAEGKKTRLQLLHPWKNLVEKYVVFLQGHSDVALTQIGVPRINFAFLDSGHDHETLRFELDYVSARQREGDVIVCDDYTPTVFPGVVDAVDGLLEAGGYEGRRFESSERRGYIHCSRKPE